MEVFHSSYRRRIGTTQDHRVVIRSLGQFAAEQLNTLALALRDEGDFVLRDEYKELLIPRSQTNDLKVVHAKLCTLFFGDPGETILARKSVVETAKRPISKELPVHHVANLPRPAMFVEFDETGTVFQKSVVNYIRLSLSLEGKLTTAYRSFLKVQRCFPKNSSFDKQQACADQPDNGARR